MTRIQRPNSSLLPGIFRTDTNKNFLNATLDQLTQPNTPSKIYGYIGDRGGIYGALDQYLQSTTAIRQNYQFVPGTVVNSSLYKPQRAITYDDLLNQLSFYGVDTSNQNKLFSQEFYTWAPPIDYDKFVNYHNYYWLPTGPDVIVISGSHDLTSIIGESTGSIGNINLMNGLKLRFSTTDITPTYYANRDVIVEGVGTSIRFIAFDQLVTPELFSGSAAGVYDMNPYDTVAFDVENNRSLGIDYITINRSSQDRNPWARSNRWFHQNVIEYTASILGNEISFDATQKAKRPIIEFDRDIKLYDHGSVYKQFVDLIDNKETDAFSNVLGQISGTVMIDGVFLLDGMRIIFAKDSDHEFVTNRTWIIESNQINGYDLATKNANFTIDVSLGAYQKVTLLSNVGITFSNWLVSSLTTSLILDITLDGNHSFTLPGNVVLPTGYSLPSTAGSYRFEFISSDNGSTINLYVRSINEIVKTINFIPAEDHLPNVIDHLLIKFGAIGGKKVMTYDGSSWNVSRQQKTTIQQFPKFDLFDSNEISLSDPTIYPGTSFTGNTIFEYSIGIGSNDVVLEFPLKYQTVNGVGDIIFSNALQNSSYDYIIEQETQTIKSNICFFLMGSEYKNDYISAPEKSKQFILFAGLADSIGGSKITIGFEPTQNDFYRTEFVYKNGKLLTSGIDYVWSGTEITFTNLLITNDYVEVRAWNPNVESKSSEVLTKFEVPSNVLINPTATSMEFITLGQIRQHVGSAVQNISLSGSYPGKSNLADLYVKNLSNLMVRNTSGSMLSGFLLTDDNTNLINSIRFSKIEYTKFKQKFMTASTQVPYSMNLDAMFDSIMDQITVAKNNTFPFAFSDMFAFGDPDISNTYVINDTNYVDFTLNYNHKLETSGSVAFLIQLIRGNTTTTLNRKSDYELVNQTLVRLKLALELNDQIVIKEYNNTDGSFCPPTPTKLGLWPSFVPSKYLDTTLITPIYVIQGHDGSITPSYGDYRDDLLLELERRIYNNLKIFYDSSLMNYDSLIPGRYRDNGFTTSEFNDIISREFLAWIGKNNLKYNTNNYDYNIAFTWNFSDTVDTETGISLPGYWRTIYRYYYDTDRPHTHPWEMLGFYEMPDWWINQYGSLPYTSDNLVLWNDLADGRIRGGETPGIAKGKIRNGLLNRIPVDHTGRLLPPNEVGISDLSLNYDVTKSWSVNDGGPTETAWIRSSEYPYALQLAASICQPSAYIYNMFNCDLLVRNLSGQLVDKNTLLPLEITNLHLQGIEEDGTIFRGSGYQQFLADWLSHQNFDRIRYFYDPIKYMTNNQLFKLAGYSDNTKLQWFLEKTSSGVSGSMVQIPAENIHYLNNKSTSIKQINYSGMIIERTTNGYSILGYDYINSYFTILPVNTAGKYSTVKMGQTSESYTDFLRDKSWQPPQIFKSNNKFFRVVKAFSGDFDPSCVVELAELPSRGGLAVMDYVQFVNSPTKISYGTEFHTVQEVYDFIIGYQHYLESIGIIFDNTIPGSAYENSYRNSAKEFLFWSLQNWSKGSVIKVSPAAYKLKISVPRGLALDSSQLNNSFFLVNQNGQPVKLSDIAINRFNGYTEIVVDSTKTDLYAANINVIEYEHVVVFDNVTLFNDLIYDPITGYRQKRIKASGYKTGGWDGSFGGSGFIIDTGIVNDWEQFKDYRYGDAVTYLNNYYFSNKNQIGIDNFDFNDWDLLPNKPTNKIYTNLDTKVTDLEHAYDMNYVIGSQDLKLTAANQIGYNKKNYLDPLVPEETSQIKFYQGFIKQKGTPNASIALSRALYSNNPNGATELNEEWAIRTGEYGSTANLQNLKIVLSEGEFTVNPQLMSFDDGQESTSPRGTIFMTLNDSKVIESPNIATNTLWKTIDVGTHSDADLLVAGHVRLDHVDYTLVTINNIQNLNSNYSDLTSGKTIFTAFDYSNNWNVFRIGVNPAKLTSCSLQRSSSGLVELEFDRSHNVKLGNWILIKNSFNADLNGWHQVVAVDKPYCLVIKVSNTFTNVPQVTSMVLYVLESLKFESLDSMLLFSPIDNWDNDEYTWVTNIGNGTWGTYLRDEKYSNTAIKLIGSQIENDKSGRSIAVTSDDYYLLSVGNFKIDVFKRNTFDQHLGVNTDFILFNSRDLTLPNTVTLNNFGYMSAIGGNNSYMLTSDPLANDTAGFDGEGCVFGMYLDPTSGWSEIPSIRSPNPQLNGYYGYGISIASGTSSTQRSIIVGTDAGSYDISGIISNINTASDIKVFRNNTILVYNTDYSITGSTLTLIGSTLTVGSYLEICIDPAYAIISEPGTNSAYIYATSTQGAYFKYVQTIIGSSGDNFGSSVSISADGSILAIGADTKSSIGAVYNYRKTGTKFNKLFVNSVATLLGEQTNDHFGYRVLLSNDGTRLFVSAYSAGPSTNGKVYVYNTATNEKIQTLLISDEGTNLQLGQTIAISPDGKKLAIGSTIADSQFKLTFDNDLTTFDNNGTEISVKTVEGGKVWIYSRYNDNYYLDGEIPDFSSSSLDKFGNGIGYTYNAIYVSAYNANDVAPMAGLVYEFDNIGNKSSWQQIAFEEPRVSRQFESRKFIYDKNSEEITDFLDSFDPAKGKIISIAEEELYYKSSYDPAFYNISNISSRLDNGRIWGNDQIGRLWWDMSTLRYLNYEQGDLNYRKTHWGQLFPGCTIDVYEWVKSKYKPSEWVAISGTSQATSLGITGIPKYFDDTNYVMSQKYNSMTQNIEIEYYYWVKNIRIVPMITNDESYNRTLSSAEVASIITNPNNLGYKYVGFIGPNTIAFYNVKNALLADQKVFSLEYQSVQSDNALHTEWLLFKSNNAEKASSDRFNSKLLDSLIGQDDSGNIIPDPLLADYRKYGTLVIPRQSMFINRREALKLLVNRTNSILIKSQILYERDVLKLYDLEEIPNEKLNLYDIVVDSYSELSYLDLYSGLRALVKVDELSFNRWSIYSYVGQEWIKNRIQSYNIPLSKIWTQSDWYADGYDGNTIIGYHIDSMSELILENYKNGDIIQVRNYNGHWRLYVKESDQFVKVGEQHATLQFTDRMYNGKYYGFDRQNYDATPFDPEPFKEIRIALTVIRDNIFINELAIHWNEIVVALFKYILSEQPYVDWLFKSSFITINQSQRRLEETVNYVKDDPDGLLNFYQELKPFHTKIREFNATYEKIDSSGNYITDYDLPVYYDNTIHGYVAPQVTQETLNGNLSWISDYSHSFNVDNFRYHLGDVMMVNAGMNYTIVPDVEIITAESDIFVTSYVLSGSQGNDIAVIDASGITIGMYVQGTGIDVITKVTAITSLVITVDNAVGDLTDGQDLTFTFVKQATAHAVMLAGKINKIVVDDEGYGYTSRPTVQISSGEQSNNVIVSVTYESNDSTPTVIKVNDSTNIVAGMYLNIGTQFILVTSVPDANTIELDRAPTSINDGDALTFTSNTKALAYALMENNLIREFDISIKFDRINTSNDIQGNTINYTISNSSGYAFSGISQVNPTLILERGNEYIFSNSISGDHFIISRNNVYVNLDQYSENISGTYPCTNGTSMIFTPDQNTPDLLYYSSSTSTGRVGKIMVVDPLMVRSRFIGNGTTTTFYLPTNKQMKTDGYVLINGSIKETSSYVVQKSSIPILSELMTTTINNFDITVSNATNLRIGNKVVGKGIRSGTTITSIVGNVISINKAPLISESIIIEIYGNERIILNSAPNLGDIIEIYSTSLVADNSYSATDRIWAYYKPTELQVAKDFSKLMVGVEYSESVVKGIDFNSTLSEDDIDEDLVGSIFRSYWGLSPSDINSSGGGFIDVYNSPAPEENVPAQIFDTLDIRIWNQGSTNMGLRMFKNMTNNFSYLRLARTTSLSTELNVNDTVIYIGDVSVLADPNIEYGYPGVIFINGERIEYYSIDRINNTITDLRRGTQGTGISTIHVVGSVIEDGSKNQIVPDADYTHNLWMIGTKLDVNTSEFANFLRLEPTDIPE